MADCEFIGARKLLSLAGNGVALTSFWVKYCSGKVDEKILPPRGLTYKLVLAKGLSLVPKYGNILKLNNI